jgi:hypothetical protein
LVTGSAERVEGVIAALRAAGVEATGVTDLASLADQVKTFPPGSLDYYVQLPVSLRPTGDSLVSRVRDFLDKGLLTRFRLAESVLPVLSADGRVVLVGGHTPVERDAPDDRAARSALLDVLAHAIRADKAPAKVRVRIFGHQLDPAELVRSMLTWEAAGDGPEARAAVSGDATISYQDWRTEVMGLASVEF